MSRPQGPFALIILDGWGARDEKQGNAIAAAGTPHLDRLAKTWGTYATLGASGLDVGLPKGFIGNSEVGHINLGSGRLHKQMLLRIDDAINNGSFFANRALVGTIKHCMKHQSTLHVVGLVQDQGVHAMTRHGNAVLELCKKLGCKNVLVHMITDGRDTAPKSALRYIKELESAVRKTPGAHIASVIGRYYAMDRDHRWDRTAKAYSCIVEGDGREYPTARAAIKAAYARGLSDEFIEASVIDNPGVSDGDGVIFFNYRLDRARQLTQAFCEPRFRGFSLQRRDIVFCGMTQYYNGMHGMHAFDELTQKNLFPEVVSKAGLRQLRVAETEKYAHVTYFFNGQNETPFPHEDRVMIPSPHVATYDATPAMSAHRITDAVVADVRKEKHEVYIVNFANADMIGHTGVWKAIVSAIRTVDGCVGKIVDEIIARDGVVIVTADHGNAEHKRGEWQKSHTTSRVPCYIFGMKGARLRNGRLSDVAPTALEILGLKKPTQMNGTSLIKGLGHEDSSPRRQPI
ncbi:2,3-bisphosphoglycerate-independent phosphoglycerate mutase [Candidatus Woesearchaeota archaeon]|nr:2,3-bisphosphoglycerate-independent phosphoglycerate mutase [Candidatus Woesearchaeota archaeon]